MQAKMVQADSTGEALEAVGGNRRVPLVVKRRPLSKDVACAGTTHPQVAARSACRRRCSTSVATVPASSDTRRRLEVVFAGALVSAVAHFHE